MDPSVFFTGPHLIGLLFILIGSLQLFLPPKNINKWYGYRTQTAKASQQAWDEGNRYSAKYMIRAGIFVLVGGFLVEIVMAVLRTDADIQKVVGYVILFGGALGIGVLSVMATEKHLAKVIKKPVVKKRK